MLTSQGSVLAPVSAPASALAAAPVASAASAVHTGATQVVPAIAAPSTSWWLFGKERDERKQIEKDGSQNHNVRRIAAYGGVFFAGMLYLAGLISIALILGLFPGYPRVAADMWHIVVAVLIALFTVPTVILIAILKVTSPSISTDIAPSVHEALGKMIEKIVGKIAG